MYKLENTPENKARFFALYWGQKVLRYNFKYYYPSEFIRTRAVSDSHLELTPLSQTSDEDAVEVASLWGRKGNSTIVISTIVGRILDVNYDAYKPIIGSSIIIDYLRSKGYAVPWMGLSIDDLVSYGWVKLREVNHG